MAVGEVHVFPGFLTPVLTQFSLQSHRLLFSHASAEVRGESTPERKFASTRARNHNHQVMNQTRSPLSHPGEAKSLGMAKTIKGSVAKLGHLKKLIHNHYMSMSYNSQCLCKIIYHVSVFK